MHKHMQARVSRQPSHSGPHRHKYLPTAAGRHRGHAGRDQAVADRLGGLIGAARHHWNPFRQAQFPRRSRPQPSGNIS